MANNCNCVNCGRKLSLLEKGTSLYPDSDEVLCFICKAMIEDRLSKYDVEIKNHNLNRSKFNEALPYLRTSGLSDSGERYLTDYVNWVEEHRKPKSRKQEIDADSKQAGTKSANPYGVNSELKKIRKRFKSTTGFDFNGYDIVKYIGIKSGEVVLGTGMFSEFSAGMSDLLGTKSQTMANKLTEAKNAALTKLIDNCVEVGANAVIGVDIDIMTIGANMIVACANGTAVVIERIESDE